MTNPPETDGMPETPTDARTIVIGLPTALTLGGALIAAAVFLGDANRGLTETIEDQATAASATRDAIQRIEAAMTTDRAAVAALDVRVRGLEGNEGRSLARYESLAEGQRETKEELRETRNAVQDLRDMIQRALAAPQRTATKP